MASWYSCRTNESLEREESDILNPEEFQHVLEVTNTADCRNFM